MIWLVLDSIWTMVMGIILKNTSKIKVKERICPPKGLHPLKNRQYNENIARLEVRDFPLGLRFKKHICLLHRWKKARETFQDNVTNPYHMLSLMLTRKLLYIGVIFLNYLNYSNVIHLDWHVKYKTNNTIPIYNNNRI